MIEYNHIRHMNLETEDTGAVYTGGRDWISSRGSVIRYNYFHDMLGYGRKGGKWDSPHFAWGVYLDDNTGGVDVIGNIVARGLLGPIHLHNGRDNHIENNVFVDGHQQQIQYRGWTTAHPFWKEHLKTMVKGYESVAGQPAWRTMRHMELRPEKAAAAGRDDHGRQRAAARTSSTITCPGRVCIACATCRCTTICSITIWSTISGCRSGWTSACRSRRPSRPTRKTRRPPAGPHGGRHRAKTSTRSWPTRCSSIRITTITD